MKILMVEDMSVIKNDNIILKDEANFKLPGNSKEIVSLDDKELIPDFVTVYVVTHEDRSVDIVRQLQNETPGIPIVVVGNKKSDNYHKLFSNGIRDFISEPITFEKLNRVFKHTTEKFNT